MARVQVPSFDTSDYSRVKGKSQYIYKPTGEVIPKYRYDKYVLQPERAHAQVRAGILNNVASRMGISHKQIAKDLGMKEATLQKYMSGEKFKGFKSADASKIEGYFRDKPILVQQAANFSGVHLDNFPTMYKGRKINITSIRYAEGRLIAKTEGGMTLYGVKITNKETGASTIQWYSGKGLRDIEASRGIDGIYEFLNDVDFELVS